MAEGKNRVQQRERKKCSCGPSRSTEQNKNESSKLTMNHTIFSSLGSKKSEHLYFSPYIQVNPRKDLLTH